MADIVAAIVEVLKADPVVSGFAEGRIFGGELPPDEAAAMPRFAVVVQPSGGAAFAPASKTRARAQRLDVICYGSTPMAAAALRIAAGDALVVIERRAIEGVLIHWVQEAGGYLTGRDRDGAWPYAFQSFQSLFAPNEVA